MSSIPDDDDQLAERLLSGHARPEDLDGPYGAVAGVLAAAARDEEVAPPGEALLRDLVAATASPVAPIRGRRRRIALVAVVVGGSALGASAAAAANGSLPDPIQEVFHDVADAVGVDIPDGDEAEDEGGAGLERGESEPSPDGPGEPRGSQQSPGAPAEPSTSNPGVGSDGVAPGQGGPIPGEADGNGGTTGGGGVEGVGPDGVPPPQGGTVPGTGETTPPNLGSDEVPPGQGGTVPGTGDTTPSEGPEDVPPGQGGTIPADEHGNAPPTTSEGGSGNGGGSGRVGE